MSDSDAGRRLSVAGAIVLIALGLWLLLGRIDLPWWGAVVRAVGFLASLAWPLALIAVGGLLLYSARTGALSRVGSSGARLYRSRDQRMVAGVLGGLGRYLGIEPTWLRLLFVLLVFSNPVIAIAAYVAAVVLVAEEPVEPSKAPEWPKPPAAPRPPAD